MSTYTPQSASQQAEETPLWVMRTGVLWRHRALLARVTTIALPIALLIAFLIPKQYKSVARIMPPDQQGSSAMLLAALASRSNGLSSLGALAGGLLGGHSTTALFIDLLRSGTVSNNIINRFDLQHLYHKRYRTDTAKRLSRLTKISDDKKSGVITIEVEDTDPKRARDMAQAYLDELNKLVVATNTSAAHQERVFIEHRLQTAQQELERAQIALSEFSSRNSTIDIKEQTHALVDIGARLEGELLVQQSSLASLRQIYGDSNVRVRQAETRIAALQHQLATMEGSGQKPSVPANSSLDKDADTAALKDNETSSLSPPLRELPRLAVPYADLYRRVKVQETVYELLTQQYEIARIDEAKDIPVVGVIDAPGIPEKKSFPPRLWLSLGITVACFGATAIFLLIRDAWDNTDPLNPAKALGAEMIDVLRLRMSRLFARSASL